jgi:hypothetical protein
VKSHTDGVPCHHCIAHPQITDGGDGLQVWRVAANILNKQPTRGGSPSRLDVGLAASSSP